jgi:beta-phosphoglucomutase
MNDYAVIFDVDGVLVDSYQAHFESWQDVARRHGFSITEPQFAALFGRTSRDIIRALWPEDAASDEAVTKIDDEKEAAYREIIAADFPVMPGSVELIESLHAAGFALALGSSGPPENVELALDGLGRRQLFGAWVTGADVTRGKPDPQVFQVAAGRLNVRPDRCAVIEDAAAGIAAANAAGMTSIALVSTGHSRGEYGEAEHVVDSLAELSVELIRRWVAKQ